MRRPAIVFCLLACSASTVAQERTHTGGHDSTEARAVTTQTIYNYRKVDDRVITSGQPREEELRAAASEGFMRVINLAPISSRNALRDEAGLVRSLDMAYDYIQVDWEQPTDADFDAFERAMQSSGDEKTLIHCAANFRVTAFYSLYAMKHLGWSQARAEEFRSSIWKGGDYPVWEEFIRRTQARIASSKGM
jgi:protein tyrosine phosphatase (PTP) superfamily phosphohydrolase (DUF442 family)